MSLTSFMSSADTTAESNSIVLDRVRTAINEHLSALRVTLDESALMKTFTDPLAVDEREAFRNSFFEAVVQSLLGKLEAVFEENELAAKFAEISALIESVAETGDGSDGEKLYRPTSMTRDKAIATIVEYDKVLRDGETKLAEEEAEMKKLAAELIKVQQKASAKKSQSKENTEPK